MADMDLKSSNVKQLSDEELKKALEQFGEAVGPITPSTRVLFERLLVRKQTGESGNNGSDTVDDARIPPQLIKSYEGEKAAVFCEASLKPEVQCYYGVHLPDNIDASGDTDLKQVYTDKTSCLAVLKKYRGSRFKSFRTYEEAQEFAECGPLLVPPQCAQGVEEPKTTTGNTNVEKPSPYRGPTPQDLVKFRKAIESDDINYFNQCINENPRYLVSSGDTPSILKEGYRYNALHVACRNNKPVHAAKVLTTVSHPRFFQRLYPDDVMETSERRCNFLLDLYLNTPDKGLNETPLHFASKHGSLECVRLLVSYPECDKSRKNKYSQSPLDIVCSRMNKSTPGLTEKICVLLGEQCYVPLFRDDDHCLLPQVGRPWSPNLESPTSSVSPDQSLLHCLSPTNSSSPISPSLKVRGYAGPMSPTQAEVFYRKWRTAASSSPVRHSKGRMPSIRLTDQDKGLEKMGRELAAGEGFCWSEYWDFLGEFTNMASKDGLDRLEAYLKHKHDQLMAKRGELDVEDLVEKLDKTAAAQNANTKVEDDSKDLDTSNVSRASQSTMGELCQELEALRLNVSLSPQGAPDSPDYVSASSKFLDAWKKKEESQMLESKVDRVATTEDPATEQLSYVMKSVRVAAHRLGDVLSDLAYDLQNNTITNLSVTKAIRMKIKPEIVCLQKVVSKCVTQELQKEVELGFVHVILAFKIVKLLQQTQTASDICVLAETMKLYVSQLSIIEANSSDEEEDSVRPFIVKEEKIGGTEHFSCVLRCVEKALSIAYNNYNSELSVDDNGNDVKVHLLQLGECNCHWIQNKNLNEEIRSSATPVSTTRYNKAFNFLHQTLFKDEHTKEKIQSDKENGNESILSVAKRLSFEEEEEEVDAGAKTLLETVNDNAQFQTSCDPTDNFSETKELAQQDDDNDSFATATSSIDDDMITPEEGLKVYISGLEPTKVDVDVLAAVSEVPLDDKTYPHVAQWLHLVSSHSEAQRKSWASPYSYQVRSTSAPNTAPSKLTYTDISKEEVHRRVFSAVPRTLFINHLQE